MNNAANLYYHLVNEGSREQNKALRGAIGFMRDRAASRILKEINELKGFIDHYSEHNINFKDPNDPDQGRIADTTLAAILGSDVIPEGSPSGNQVASK